MSASSNSTPTPANIQPSKQKPLQPVEPIPLSELELRYLEQSSRELERGLAFRCNIDTRSLPAMPKRNSAPASVPLGRYLAETDKEEHWTRPVAGEEKK
ncbi:Protein of unknown function [Pyronema omphalodes CBS 100304]|uniref:Uncharacterized protein n=1 Tax=Pyronema omphalodes (strain CBS 100304) TaxID=1076935 RepID=U4LWP8_PYROM|nr:Protein of unknown function [Pyronema omphalodes CBS 100304]